MQYLCEKNYRKTFIMSHRKLKIEELNRVDTETFKNIRKIPLIVVMDNVRSLYNIGAVFRTADAFCVESVYLCGICPTPPNAEIHKTALGAELSVYSKHFESTLDAVNELKQKGYKVMSVEQTEGSVSLEKIQVHKDKKYAVVFGHEVNGVQQEVIDASDGTIEIPQFGTKHSLNVSTTAGIVMWEFAKELIVK